MDADNNTSLQEGLLSDEMFDYVYLKDIKQGHSKRLRWKCSANLTNKSVLFIVCCLFAIFASAEMGGSLVNTLITLLRIQ